MGLICNRDIGIFSSAPLLWGHIHKVSYIAADHSLPMFPCSTKAENMWCFVSIATFMKSEAIPTKYYHQVSRMHPFCILRRLLG